MSSNVYDQVSYSNLPSTRTHPDLMAVLARLRGLNPPPIDRARVLDLGANEGGCLLPIAISLAGAECTGIELAAAPVERGNRIISELGLANVRLLQMNLLDIGASLGQFDYIIAHGLYAWTPPAVREKILEIAHSNLTPDGIAMVSYNTLPGGHIRKLLRDAMLFQGGGATDPSERIQQARGILTLMANAPPAEATGMAKAIAEQAATALERSDAAIFHDFLAEEFEPVYFRDFVVHAARHGLWYVDDSGVVETWNPPLCPDAVEAVSEISGGNRLLREQYLDLLRVRYFRGSLLCHAPASPESGPQPSWIASHASEMFAASSTRETHPGEFETCAGTRMKTGHEGVMGFLRRCARVWPEPIPIAAADAELAIALFQRGLIDLRTFRGVARRAGERPLASPLARYQARAGSSVTTLVHSVVQNLDAKGRQFLQLLDGNHDREALARDLGSSPEQVEKDLEAAADLALLLG
jgi:SAM-dependent methyltransferase